MFSASSIRVKLLAAFVVLVLLVLIQSSTTLYTTYSFRDFVKYLTWRSQELPVAAELSYRVGALRMSVSELRGMRANAFPGSDTASSAWWIHNQFPTQLVDLEDTLIHYRHLLQRTTSEGKPIDSHQLEVETLRAIDEKLLEVHEQIRDQNWTRDGNRIEELASLLNELHNLAEQLPDGLHTKLSGLTDEIRDQYHLLISLTWLAGIATAMLFLVFLKLVYQWIFYPLQVLIDGSRHVASGRFNYRIHLDTHDEMAELAEALNQMTERFEAIRDDLDHQVRERTKQVVRNEQLASVGFLAAGVAHEINNPLASIAMCAESLEGRLGGLEAARGRPSDTTPPDERSDASPDDRDIAVRYLRMIQDEAFRCKQITEKLLDFSRMGQAKRCATDLVALVRGVVDMVGHLGKYQGRRIEFQRDEPLWADVNGQEIKQIVLNLLTNALDSLEEEGGVVRLELDARDDMAQLVMTDNGCGMDEDILNHIFEPFFTQRRRGQGTGLGLSITHRIVADHGGEIEAQSDGPGQGSIFTVRLPLSERREPPAMSKQTLRAARSEHDPANEASPSTEDKVNHAA